ncbi:unnamed protein product [Toxocara canis]|uniref:Serine protease n=1 Tax=Toxocara canis TaxID=6265 RepID=A0A183U8M6_TOXCA|nr:unnamed protein product [Toxocara canis]
MTRRRLRRSLDNQPSPLNILKLSDIVVPENALYSVSFDFEANSPQGLLVVRSAGVYRSR